MKLIKASVDAGSIPATSTRSILGRECTTPVEVLGPAKSDRRKRILHDGGELDSTRLGYDADSSAMQKPLGLGVPGRRSN